MAYRYFIDDIDRPWVWKVKDDTQGLIDALEAFLGTYDLYITETDKNDSDTKCRFRIKINEIEDLDDIFIQV